MPDPTLAREIARRRTFAIISHPDAGKTTLTEKLLLYGGAIHLAGSVRARKNQRAATSDWMELERERGISITSTVLQFDYKDRCINLLDTPGHKDFSEDTYRVLTAVDSAIMVIDAAKGIEDRTRKLFEICSIRGVPIFTFVNKMDRPSRDPLSILDEIEKVLGIGAFPVTWPLGSGDTFKGVYDRLEKQVHLFERTVGGQHKAPTSVGGPDDDQLRAQFDPETYAAWRDEIEMLHGAGEAFEAERVLAGKTTPVFFGSALTNFGVQLLLDYFVRYGAAPVPRNSTNGPIQPDDETFSAFVFKVQANMNPRHRDNLSFIRICSGRFEKDMVVPDPRNGKPIRLAYPQKLFAQGRETMEVAYAGDIVGLVSHDPFRIGDTLAARPDIRYDEIPRFAPEVFSLLRNANPSKAKQFNSGLGQLLDEGVIQSFRLVDSVTNVPLLGAVGPLQFEVVLYRLQNEYGADVRLEPAAFKEIRWFSPGVTKKTMQDAYLGAGVALAEDIRGQLVILFPDKWNLDYFMSKNPKLELHHVSPHAVAVPSEE
jgi:peptide chain release factor 3